jgi:hypothetical protein
VSTLSNKKKIKGIGYVAFCRQAIEWGAVKKNKNFFFQKKLFFHQKRSIFCDLTDFFCSSSK